MTQQKKLKVVVGDAGACLDLILPVTRLQDQGVDVEWFVDPNPLARAGTVLDRYGVSYAKRGPTYGDRQEGSLVVLIGTSTKAIGLQLAWTSWASLWEEESVWFDDLMVNACRRDVMGVYLHRVFCINTLGQSIVNKLRPGVTTAVVGKPSFGALPSDEQVAETRKRIRAKYDVQDGQFFVTFGFAGEPADRAWAQLEQIMTHRSLFRQDTICAFRFHPAHPRAEEMWRRVAGCGLNVQDARSENLLDLYVASDAVVADYVSTDPYKLLLLSVPTITLLFPEDAAYRRELGYPDGVPPIIMGYEGWGIESVSELVRMLEHVREYPDSAQMMTVRRSEAFSELVKLDSTELLAREIARLL